MIEGDKLRSIKLELFGGRASCLRDIIIFKIPNLRILSLVHCENLECIFLNHIGNQITQKDTKNLRMWLFNAISLFIINQLYNRLGRTFILLLINTCDCLSFFKI
jgi:hypothetical protein